MRSGSAPSSRSTSSTTPSAARRWTPASSACSSTAATTSRRDSFWDVKTCTGPEHDQTQLTMPAARWRLGGLVNALASRLTGGAPLPVYPPPPHCNQRGLTELGAYLIDQMIQEHFIVELDHMDAKTADATLSILEAAPLLGRDLRPQLGFAGGEPPDLQPRRFRDADRRRLAAVVRRSVAGEPQGAQPALLQRHGLRLRRRHERTGRTEPADRQRPDQLSVQVLSTAG